MRGGKLHSAPLQRRQIHLTLMEGVPASLFNDRLLRWVNGKCRASTGAKYQISKTEDFGHHPVWSPDGKELLFTPNPGNRLHVVSISTQPAFSVGEAVVLTRPFVNDAPWLERPYDIGRDGQRFLGVIDATEATQSGGPQAQQIRVVQNWVEELKAKVK